MSAEKRALRIPKAILVVDGKLIIGANEEAIRRFPQLKSLRHIVYGNYYSKKYLYTHHGVVEVDADMV